MFSWENRIYDESYDSPDPRKTMYYPQFDWPKNNNPKIHFPLDEQSLKDVIHAENEALNK
ncbi:MAG: hypothetical protein Ct9H300mP18_08090 [Candidatus Neomarinimicrobiota bacterium]|nr:MAG: hypothetical protein Ct9H300mP18_08090 [Candidatus Neomarinimicrobiota bacterium]